MVLPAQNQMAWKVCITFLHALAISMCIVRLGHRMRMKRLWWDDYIIIIPLVLDVVYIIKMWVKYGTAVVVMMIYRILKPRTDDAPPRPSNLEESSSEKSEEPRQNPPTEYSPAPSYTVMSVSEGQNNPRSVSTGLVGTLLSVSLSSRPSNNRSNRKATINSATTVSSWDFSSFDDAGSRNVTSTSKSTSADIAIKQLSSAS